LTFQENVLLYKQTKGGDEMSDTPTDRTDAAWDASEIICDGDSFERAEYMRDFAEGLERELAAARERLAIISNIWGKLDQAIKEAGSGEVGK
jgi:hypothetical protein